MRGGWGGACVLIGLWLLVSGCYATSSTPPGPNCIQDPSNPACAAPLTDDQTKPDAGR
jgi:hypothetical protein